MRRTNPNLGQNYIGSNIYSVALRSLQRFAWLALVLVFVSCSGPASSSSRLNPQSKARDPLKEVAEHSAKVEIRHPQLAADTRLTLNVTPKSNFLPTAFDSLPVHDGLVTALEVSKDGKTAFSAGRDGKVKQVEIASDGSRQAKVTTLLEGNEVVLALSLSPDERYLAVSVYSYITLYDLKERKLAERLTKIDGRVTALAWSPSGRELAIGRSDGDVFIWWPFLKLLFGTSDNEAAIERYEGSSSPIVSLVFHPAGRTLFTAEQNGRVNFWRLLQTEREMGLRDEQAFVDREKKGSKVIRLATLPTKVQDMWYGPERGILFVAGADGTIYRYKIRGSKRLTNIVLGTDAIFNIAGFTKKPENKNILAVSVRGSSLVFVCQGSVSLYKEKLLPPGVIYKPEVNAQEVGASGELVDEVSMLRIGGNQDILWAAQKTGSLLIFKTEKIQQRKDIHASFLRCS